MVNIANKPCREYVLIFHSLNCILKNLQFIIMTVIFMCSYMLENIKNINQKIKISLIIPLARRKHLLLFAVHSPSCF